MKIKNEEFLRRIEGEIAVLREIGPDSPLIKALNEGQVQFPEGDGFMMLPQDKTIKINEEIDQENVVLPSAFLEHLIKNASHRVIMNICLCRYGLECKDYPIDMGCIFLGDAAKKIDPELGRAASVGETLEYAAKCREMGLVHIVGRNHQDLNWLNKEVGPITKLMTVCNCCPCCCALTMVRYLKPDVGGKSLSPMPGVEVAVTEECTGCGLCEEKCVFNAIQMKDGQAEISKECKACGRCVNVCPEDAIEITVADPGYIQKGIRIVSDKVHYT